MKVGTVVKLKPWEEIKKTLNSCGYHEKSEIDFVLDMLLCSPVMTVVRNSSVNSRAIICETESGDTWVLDVDWVSTVEPPATTSSEVRIDKIIYNDPATVVFWSDGTKTTTRVDKDDEFNPTASLAICYMKKFLGNKEACKLMRKWEPDSFHEVMTYRDAIRKDQKRCEELKKK